MNVNNLTNVYNQNPTLQGQYTLQQYLDLFGGSSTTTTSPTTTTTTTPTTNTSQGIINANINQFQNQGGGDGGGITTIGNNRINSNNPTFRDPLNEKIANKMRTDNPNLEKYTNKEVISSNPDMFDIKETKTGFIDGVKNTATDLLDLYKTYSPMGFIGRKIEQTQQAKVERERVAAEKARKEREAQAAIAAADRARAANASVYASADRQGFTDGKGGGFGSKSTGTNENFSNNSGRGRTGYDYGGRVGAKDGGSMTQIVKDRLMEKNPAMWGIGYEGLASLQDLIMSMPFNQGGIVNIRRR